jgi:hypothetical protein
MSLDWYGETVHCLNTLFTLMLEKLFSFFLYRQSQFLVALIAIKEAEASVLRAGGCAWR